METVVLFSVDVQQRGTFDKSSVCTVAAITAAHTYSWHVNAIVLIIVRLQLALHDMQFIVCMREHTAY